MENSFILKFYEYYLGSAHHAHSAGNWYGPYTISSVGKVIEGIHKVTITVNEPVNTGCAINDSTKTMKNASDNYVHVDGMLSVSLAAQAQKKKVMVYFPNSICYQSGLDLWGIKVLTD
ncbi:hypothetical protein [Vibrio sp. J383]|uniref:hypothetical protein n=1 Tax=Vibrio sp. J383 TaxID=2942997 RepID=UPI0020C00D70|nr:hypothetical protein [Vibrio sp. J383]UQV24818.1 hypothetical protein M4S28_26115 [Vibrio sp. J383]